MQLYEPQKLVQQEKLQIAARIKELAKDARITVNITGAAKKSGNSLPKCQHPDDPMKTWTGRGKRPSWLNELLSQGKTLENLKISR